MKKIFGIKKNVIKMIMESARDTYPKEFACLLRHKEGVIKEVILLPGTIGGNSSALVYLHMMPVDFSLVGTAHSHPSGNTHPSETDLNFFRRFGSIHIIVGYPYTDDCFSVYNFNGEPIKIDILDDE